MTTARLAGPPAATPVPFIPLCVPEIRGNEWAYVRECLDTGWVSSAGPFVERFERELAAAAGTACAVATVNGTAALHVALLLAGVRRDDEVVMPALTFIAPANAVRYAGAWPVFLDVEPDFFQLDGNRLERFLRQECTGRDGALWNRATGRRVRALLPVHVLGHPVDMTPVLALAREFGLTIVEDATESLGARWRGQPVGGLGLAGCFSFNGNKLLTTGGGGMLVTDDAALAERARYLTTQAKDDPVEYVHGAIGYNYRLTNLQAAMGVAQLERLDAYLARKREIAARYEAAFRDLPAVRPMAEADWAESAWWMYTVLVDESVAGIDSRGLMRALEREKIQTRPLWQPLHQSPAHADAPPADCPVAERLARMALSLPCSVGLDEPQQTRVIERVLAILAGGGA